MATSASVFDLLASIGNIELNPKDGNPRAKGTALK